MSAHPLTSPQPETQTSPPSSSEVEEAFLHAVEFGDVSLVKSLLEEYPNVNVDCTDALGRTPLRLAVKNENKELVEILLYLSSPENMQQALLQAIDAGFTNIAEVTLRHTRYMETFKRMRRMGDTDGFFKPERGSQFPSYVTALNLAAQKNQYVIVQLLLQRGETINKPHKFDCLCQECMNKNKFDQLRSAKCRLDAYRGLASEAYISLFSKDPFLTAFELAHELRKLADAEVFFKKEYTDLADQLSDYVVKLLDRVWTQRELSAVLDKTGSPQEDTFESLARFKMALEYKEKLFVSHPNCQQRIDRCWSEGMGKMGRVGWSKQLALLLLSGLFYPVMVVGFLCAPNSQIGKSLSVPAVKFISHTVSFFIFLIFIVASSIESIGMLSNTNTLAIKYPAAYDRYTMFRNVTSMIAYGSDFPLRAHELTITEIFIVIWLIAMIVQECQEIWSSGLLAHLSDWFNVMDLLLLSVYIATYFLKFYTLVKWNKSLQMLSSNQDLSDHSSMLTYVYWLNADRIYWDTYDPLNMSEGLFALANILSFTRIAYLMPANESLGPLQISLGRMMVDIVKFFALAFIVIGAFMVALTNLYWYYIKRDDIELDSSKVEDPEAVKYYGGVLDTFRTVFWEIYGRGDIQSVGLGQYNNSLTSNIGQGIDGMYNIFMIIVLLNILIAMMSRSFDKIQEDADVEWKFARSTLYMDYITKGRVLPVPFNMFELCFRLINHCLGNIKKKGPQEPDSALELQHGGRRAAVANVGSERHLKSKSNGLPPTGSEPKPATAADDAAVAVTTASRAARAKGAKGFSIYQDIIQSIVQRYIYDVQRENEVTGGNTDDVKNHFEHLRLEILAQYKVKDESLSMSLGAVHSMAEDLSSITGKTAEEMGFPTKSQYWPGNCSSSEFQDSFLILNANHELSSLGIEPHKDILCDVYEEADEIVEEHDEGENANNLSDNPQVSLLDEVSIGGEHLMSIEAVELRYRENSLKAPINNGENSTTAHDNVKHTKRVKF